MHYLLNALRGHQVMSPSLQHSAACVTLLQSGPALSCPNADIPCTHATVHVVHRSNASQRLIMGGSSNVLHAPSQKQCRTAADGTCSCKQQTLRCAQGAPGQCWSLNGLPVIVQARASLEHMLRQEISEGKAGIEGLRCISSCSTTAMDTDKDFGLPSTAICLSKIHT